MESPPLFIGLLYISTLCGSFHDLIVYIEEISYFLTIDFIEFYNMQKGNSPQNVEYIKCYPNIST
jgi:hypothetical protein